MAEGMSYPHQSIQFVTGERFIVAPSAVKEIRLGPSDHPAFVMVYILFEGEDVPDRVFKAFPGTFVIECGSGTAIDVPTPRPALVIPTTRLAEMK